MLEVLSLFFTGLEHGCKAEFFSLKVHALIGYFGVL